MKEKNQVQGQSENNAKETGHAVSKPDSSTDKASGNVESKTCGGIPYKHQVSNNRRGRKKNMRGNERQGTGNRKKAKQKHLS